MSFYRNFIIAVASLGLSTAVLAAQGPNAAAGHAGAANKQEIQQATATSAESLKVDINKATVEELAKIKGMNHAKAKSIVSYRKKHGEFKSLDELKEVRGFKKMNEKALKDIQGQMTIG